MLLGLACAVASASGCVEPAPAPPTGLEASGIPDAPSDPLDGDLAGLTGPPPSPLPPCGDSLATGATEQDLPGPVARTRRLLRQAALDGDWGTIDSLSRGSPDFKFSFADPGGGAAAYWITYQGESFLQDLALTFALAPMEDGGTYTWPATASRTWGDATEAERADIACLTSSDAVAEMDREGHYLGPRTAIALDGPWGYFLSGD